MARSHARRKIAVLMDHVDHLEGGYATEVRLGLDRAAAERDVDLLIFAGRELGVTPHCRVYDFVHPNSVDGVVLLGAGLSARTSVTALRELVARLNGIPACSLGLSLDGVPSVTADNRPGLAALFDHLIVDHGRRRLSFLGGYEHNPDARVRLAVYREALARHGLPFDEALVVADAYDVSSGALAMREVLRRGSPFDAVLAGNDGAAVGALEALRERGLAVPRDVALTGFDDLALCRFTKPTLTTVRQPIARMAELSIAIVCEQLDGNTVENSVTLPVEMVRRASCGCDVYGSERRPVTVALLRPQPAEWFRGRRSILLRELRDVLGPAQDDDWISELLDSVSAELGGTSGALCDMLERLSTRGSRARSFDELTRALSLLRAEFAACSDPLEELWISAQRAVGTATAAEQVQKRTELETAYLSLLRSAERLSSVFDLQELRAVLSQELPGLLLSAFISLSVPGSAGELEPFFGMCDGSLRDSRASRIAKGELWPSDVELPERRRTWLVLPLTSELELLGLALIEMQPTVAKHEILRAQLSSALRAVALHREIVNTTAQHERSVQERAATAKRMSALSVLAGGVAHDLNNALGPLVALPDVMLGELNAGRVEPELSADLITIRSAALRAAQTIKDLLALGREGHTERAPLDLGQLVSASFVAESSVREEAARRGVRVSLDLCDELLVVRGSEAQLGRAVSNLLRNAIEAIEGSGSVTLSTRRVLLREPLAAYETIEAGDYATLSVSDTGAGIDKADLGRVFEPFFTKKKLSESSGSGLGLAIVHGAVKEHAGFADVVSDRGKGTRFTLYIPLAAEPLCEKRAPSSTPGGSANVLVVDDDPVQLRTAMRVLTRFGYRVVTAASCNQGYDLFHAAWQRDGASGYDLVLLDMQLDDVTDGLELFERLQALAPLQRGIVVSGHAPTGRIEDAVARGLPFLAKPYTADELGRAVRAALSARTPNRNSYGVPSSQRKLKLLK